MSPWEGRPCCLLLLRRLETSLGWGGGGRNMVQNTFRAPWLGPEPGRGGKSHRGGRQGREPQAQSLSPASLCVARCQGAERSSYIPLKKIDLFTVTFSIVSWVFGKEHLSAPQAFRGADGGAAPDRRAKLWDLWLLRLCCRGRCRCGQDVKPLGSEVGQMGS